MYIKKNQNTNKNYSSITIIEKILDKHEVRIISALLVIFYTNKTNLKEKK